MSQWNYLAACFDELLNGVVQKGRLDLCLRFWDCKSNKVAIRGVPKTQWNIYDEAFCEINGF